MRCRAVRAISVIDSHSSIHQGTKENIVVKHIITLSVLTLIIALAGVALAHHPVKAHGAQTAQTMEPILPFDEKLATPM
jgi:cytosine/uracil/thiamine/allantoin permease